MTIGKLPAALEGIYAQLYHNIHDELVIETSQPEQSVEALRSTMVAGFLEVFPEGESLTHDLVDVRVGRSWAEVH